MSLLSKHRTHLLGIAAMGTVITHSNYFLKSFPSIVRSIFSYGGMGVYIFALLSGMGLYFSLNNAYKLEPKDAVVIKFYKRRLTRVFIPYVIIVGFWYAIKYLIVLNQPLNFLYELSTVSFWADHKGAWYVAMLIPVYLLFPYYYNWIEKGKRRERTAITFFTVLSIGVFAYWLAPSLYEHLSSVWCSVLFVILGNYIGKAVKENSFDGKWICLFSISFFLLKFCLQPLKKLAFINDLSYAFLGVAIAIISAYILEKIRFKFVYKVLAFLGEYSLEIYLTNLVWIQLFQFFEVEKLLQFNGVIIYLIIIVLGLISSVIFGKLTRKIVNYIN